MTYARKLVAISVLNVYMRMHRDWLALAREFSFKKYKRDALKTALKRKCEGIVTHDRILIEGTYRR
ncbi:hypothetical protein MIFENG_21 [Hafnia phage vB_HpaM_Meifeng]|nr:hypothetical protein MIFENG_21 [Hafnia phage vB_HpaM_Meifeng]